MSLELPLLQEIPSDSKTLILTRTSLQARFLQEVFPKMPLGNYAHPLDAWWFSHTERWLERRNTDLAPEEAWRVLDRLEERMLWEASMPEDAPVLQPSLLAPQAQDAHWLEVHWRLEPTAEAPLESALYQNWKATFLERCQRLRGISRPEFLRQFLEAPEWDAAPAQVLLYGFSELSPLEHELLAELRRRGAALFELQAPESPTLPQFEVFSDPQAELQAAAQWTARKLQEQPNARIGWVLPNLENVESILERLLREALHPAEYAQGQLPAHPRYRIGFRPELRLDEALEAARNLLELTLRLWRKRLLPWELVSFLLRSPYWDGLSGELGLRAELDVLLRSSRQPEFSWERWMRWISGGSEEHVSGGGTGFPGCPSLQRVMRQVEKLSRELGSRRRNDPVFWIQHFLQTCGWDASLHEREREYFSEAILQTQMRFQSWRRINPGLSRERELQTFLRMLKEHSEAQQDLQPSVWVLSPREAADVRFDAVRLLGMTDEVWPGSFRPNPLLSLARQQASNVPGSRADLHLQQLRTLSQGLLCTSAEVLISWAQWDGEKGQGPTRLFGEVLSPRRGEPGPSPRRQLFEQERFELEEVVDDQGAEVPEGGHVSGGTGLLQAQAACPLKAYAEYRLGIRPLEEPLDAYDAAQRGQVVHLALERFWSPEVPALRHSDSLSAGDLNVRIRQSVEAAFNEFEQNRTPLPPRFRQLEIHRVVRLLERWMKMERNRPSFRVLACEEEREFVLEGLQLRVVLDRRDEDLRTGKQLVIDYKTGGTADFKDWTKERLLSPQLPLYSMVQKAPPVSALAFAKLNPSSLGYSGVAEVGELAPGVKLWSEATGLQEFSSWAELQQSWEEKLTELAREIRRGHAVMRFEDEKVFRYSAARAFCRVAEALARQREPEAGSREGGA